MPDQQTFSQSDDGRLRVVNSSRGALWLICSGGTCVCGHSGEQVMARYRALLISQGKPVPPA